MLTDLVRSTALELEGLAVEKGLELAVSIPVEVATLRVRIDGLAVARILRNVSVTSRPT